MLAMIARSSLSQSSRGTIISNMLRSTHQRRLFSFTALRSAPKIMLTLYAKEGCSLCDKAKVVLQQVRKDETLRDKIQIQYVDITDPMNNEWWDSYCFDVPVLHLDRKHEDAPVKFMHYLDAEKIAAEIKK